MKMLNPFLLLFCLNLSTLPRLLAESKCDVASWYVDMAIKGLFGERLNRQQMKIKNSVELMMKQSSLRKDPLEMECDILSTYESILDGNIKISKQSARNHPSNSRHTENFHYEKTFTEKGQEGAEKRLGTPGDKEVPSQPHGSSGVSKKKKACGMRNSSMATAVSEGNNSKTKSQGGKNAEAENDGNKIKLDNQDEDITDKNGSKAKRKIRDINVTEKDGGKTKQKIQDRDITGYSSRTKQGKDVTEKDGSETKQEIQGKNVTEKDGSKIEKNKNVTKKDAGTTKRKIRDINVTEKNASKTKQVIQNKDVTKKDVGKGKPDSSVTEEDGGKKKPDDDRENSYYCEISKMSNTCQNCSNIFHELTLTRGKVKKKKKMVGIKQEFCPSPIMMSDQVAYFNHMTRVMSPVTEFCMTGRERTNSVLKNDSCYQNCTKTSARIKRRDEIVKTKRDASFSLHALFSKNTSFDRTCLVNRRENASEVHGVKNRPDENYKQLLKIIKETKRANLRPSQIAPFGQNSSMCLVSKIMKLTTVEKEYNLCRQIGSPNVLRRENCAKVSKIKKVKIEGNNSSLREKLKAQCTLRSRCSLMCYYAYENSLCLPEFFEIVKSNNAEDSRKSLGAGEKKDASTLKLEFSVDENTETESQTSSAVYGEKIVGMGKWVTDRANFLSDDQESVIPNVDSKRKEIRYTPGKVNDRKPGKKSAKETKLETSTKENLGEMSRKDNAEALHRGDGGEEEHEDRRKAMSGGEKEPELAAKKIGERESTIASHPGGLANGKDESKQERGKLTVKLEKLQIKLEDSGEINVEKMKQNEKAGILRHSDVKSESKREEEKMDKRKPVVSEQRTLEEYVGVNEHLTENSKEHPETWRIKDGINAEDEVKKLKEFHKLVEDRSKECNTKMHALELSIIKLENQVLTENIKKQNHSNLFTRLENHILRLENELLRLNASYSELKSDNERLHRRQRKYLELSHIKTGNPPEFSSLNRSSQVQRKMAEQRTKMMELRYAMEKQKAMIGNMKNQSDYLEGQNRMLFQIVMNQTLLISHIMKKMEILSEQVRGDQNRKGRTEVFMTSKELMKQLGNIVSSSEYLGAGEWAVSGAGKVEKKRTPFTSRKSKVKVARCRPRESGFNRGYMWGFTRSGSEKCRGRQGSGGRGIKVLGNGEHGVGLRIIGDGARSFADKGNEDGIADEADVTADKRHEGVQLIGREGKKGETGNTVNIRGERSSVNKDGDGESNGNAQKQRSSVNVAGGEKQGTEEEKISLEINTQKAGRGKNDVARTDESRKSEGDQVSHDERQDDAERKPSGLKKTVVQKGGGRQRQKEGGVEKGDRDIDRQVRKPSKNTDKETKSRPVKMEISFPRGEEPREKTKTSVESGQSKLERTRGKDNSKESRENKPTENDVNSKVGKKPRTKGEKTERKPLLYTDSDRSRRDAKDCYDLYIKGNVKNDVYKIKPTGLNEWVEVFCDMKNGGWTIIQIRKDGTTNFFRSWNDYKQGFGGVYGEHWAGNDLIHQLTNQKYYNLLVELTDWENNKRFAKYDYFMVDSNAEGYRLHIGGYSGNAGDGLAKHNKHKFSTKDVDNDQVGAELGGKSCAERFQGAWWYYKCYASNLNGRFYRNGIIPEKRYDGITWKAWKGSSYSFLKTEMKIKPIL